MSFQLAPATECIELLATHFANLGLFNSHSLRSVSNLAEIFETHCDLSTRTHYGVYPAVSAYERMVGNFQLALTTECITIFLHLSSLTSIFQLALTTECISHPSVESLD